MQFGHYENHPFRANLLRPKMKLHGIWMFGCELSLVTDQLQNFIDRLTRQWTVFEIGSLKLSMVL